MNHGQILAEYGQFGVPGSVAASYVQALLEVAGQHGADPGKLLALAGMTLPEVSTARVPVERLLVLFDLARDVTGDIPLGLRMGSAAKPRMFNALGYAAMSCRTLGEAVSLIPRYEAVVYDGAVTSLSMHRDQVTIAWQPAGLASSSASMRPLNEAIVAGWLSYGRWITGQHAGVLEARFQHAASSALAEYKAFFGCEPRFGAVDNALVFDRALLDLPLIQHDDHLRQLMEQQAESLLAQIRGESSMSRRVLEAIHRALPHGVCSCAEIAQALALSERSLRRQLQEEGSSFSALLATVREELARAYLANDALSMLDITLLLGYAEQSAFSAAFKSWTGMSPREFQARLRLNDL